MQARVFVYRNLVKALPWFTQVREKIQVPRHVSSWCTEFSCGRPHPLCVCVFVCGRPTRQKDPAYAGWFLKFSGTGNYHVPDCDANYSPPRCSDFYHDQDQTPEHPHGDGSCVKPCDCGEGVPCGE
jgi:hypothetical protein